MAQCPQCIARVAPTQPWVTSMGLFLGRSGRAFQQTLALRVWAVCQRGLEVQLWLELSHGYHVGSPCQVALCGCHGWVLERERHHVCALHITAGRIDTAKRVAGED